eukprot:7866929-Ditylum_brightwellii.AAC.1
MDKIYFLTWKTDMDLDNCLSQLVTFLEEEADFLGDIGCEGYDDDQIEDDDECRALLEGSEGTQKWSEKSHGIKNYNDD